MRCQGCDSPPAARRDSLDPSLGARPMALGSRAMICFLGFFFFKALICCYQFPRRNEEKRLQMDS